MSLSCHTNQALASHVYRFGTLYRSDIRCSLAGNDPCINGGACTDGIGKYTCACATGFCGPTCADPAQSNGQCPCADDPAWVDADVLVDTVSGHTLRHPDDQDAFTCSVFNVPDNRQYCSGYADAAGVTPSEACPVSCQSPCALTYDDCCELSPPHLTFRAASHVSLTLSLAAFPPSSPTSVAPWTPSYTFSLCSLTCVSVSPSSLMFTLTTPGPPPVISQGTIPASTAEPARTASGGRSAPALPDSAARPAPTRWTYQRTEGSAAWTTQTGPPCRRGARRVVRHAPFSWAMNHSAPTIGL